MPRRREVTPHPVPPCRGWFSSVPCRVEPLPHSGFSGSPLFRVEAAGGTYVLKAFPADMPATRVRFVHALMRHLRGQGIEQVPAVSDAVGGESFLLDSTGRAWELQEFVAGEPAFEPTAAQVTAAVSLLARVHAAAANMPENPPDIGPSPAIARRIEQARVWLARPWERIGERSVAAGSGLGEPVRGLLETAAAALRHAGGDRIIRAIATLGIRPLSRQSVVRDIWAAHVLFDPADPARVSGLIDFHAATTDAPATDVARLLGSWITAAAGRPDWWTERLADYEPPRPRRLDQEFRDLVMFLAASGIVFGLDNWFRWVLEEQRAFADPAAVVGRIDRLLEALSPALEILGQRGNVPGLTGENCSL